MSEQSIQASIPESKLERAGKLVGAGAKVGANYMKHFAKKLVNKDVDRTELDAQNAKDLYSAFSNLKGGPLKIAQMLSMSENFLPKAFTNEFAKAQNQVTPLSFPLIRKTIKAALGQYPEEIFEEFSRNAVNAASIGQVHQARKNGQKLAIKIQYPGVAESLKSDLKLMKPVAAAMFGFSNKEIDPYFNEVEQKLLEETNYQLELSAGLEMTQNLASLKGIVLPKFYPELSSQKVLTMSWIEGQSLTQWLNTNPSQAQRDQIGQILWDFYQYLIHEVRCIHADPHPGNFLVTDDLQLGILDFGCTKALPETFYNQYHALLQIGWNEQHPSFETLIRQLEILQPEDDGQTINLVKNTFGELYNLVTAPLYSAHFDFGDITFFDRIYALGEEMSRKSELRGISARGSRHFIYFNRTFFGLYQLLHQLKANVKIEAVGVLA